MGMDPPPGVGGGRTELAQKPLEAALVRES